ncbi:MAG: pyrroline-5-carboxylate reductase [Parachlamydiaceae bacterium]
MDIAIIGCGNMGTAVAELLSPLHRLILHDRDWNWTQELAHKIGGEPRQNINEAIDEAEVVFLAVKPQNLKEIAPLIKDDLKKNHILISLLVGTPLESLQNDFPSPTIIRIMPNLAMRYGEGIIGVVDTPALSLEIKNSLEELLAPLGLLYWLQESQIDALASLAGSGPAFILTLVEAMIEAGIAMGFKAKDAKNLTLKMMQGSLTMIEKSDTPLCELKWQIASPGGTTIEGLRRLEKGSLRSGLIETFLASHKKAQELAKKL